MIQSFLVDGKRFIFEEQVPAEAPKDSQLLLDCNLSPIKGERERVTFQHHLLLKHVGTTKQLSTIKDYLISVHICFQIGADRATLVPPT